MCFPTSTQTNGEFWDFRENRPLNYIYCYYDPKSTLLGKTASFEPLPVKIIRYVRPVEILRS
jgi:hypothetical protein